MMKVLCTRAAKCESGATAMEYALTVAILSMVMLTGADTLGEMVDGHFLSLSDRMETASNDTGQVGRGKQLVSSQVSGTPRFLSISYTSQPPRP